MLFFDVGFVGSSGNGVGNGFLVRSVRGSSSPFSPIERNPIRVEDRGKNWTMVPERRSRGRVRRITPVWFEPVARGGTPMREPCLTRAAEELVSMVRRAPQSYPPTCLHVTNSESTDERPRRR